MINRVNCVYLAPLYLLCALLLSPCAALAQDEPAAERAIDGETIRLRIEAVEASTDLDEEVSATLVDQYRRALVNLDREQLEDETAARYVDEARQSNDELLNIQRENGELREALAATPAVAPGGLDEDGLEAALASARTELDAAESELSRLRDLYAQEIGRPGPARNRLAEARTERDRAALESDTALSDIPEVAAAQRLERETRIRALDAEVRKLEQELLTHEPRIALLAAKGDRAGLLVEQARTAARTIEDAISARSGAAAEQALQEAMSAQEALEGRHPAIAELAEGNVALGDGLTALVGDIESVSDERDAVKRRMAQLEAELGSTRAKLAVAGLNQALGQLLIDQRRSLPNPRSLQKRIREREREAGDIGLRQIEFAEQLRLLRDRERYIDELLGDSEEPASADVRDELDRLLQDRGALLERSIDTGVRYLRVLGELDLAERQLADAVVEYGDFLDTKLLWVRNTPPIDKHALRSLPDDLERLARSESWSRLGSDLRLTIKERPWTFALVAVLALLGMARLGFLARVDACAANVGRIRNDRFTDSLHAVLFTLLAAAPLPLAVAIAGGAVTAHTGSEPFTLAIAGSISRAAINFLFIQFFFDLARNDGVLLKHCGWSEFSVGKLRGEFGWFRLAYPLSMVITEVNFALDAGGTLGTLTLLGSGVTAASLVALAYRLFTPEGGVLRDFLGAHPRGLLTQTRPLWLGLLALSLPATVVLWLSGFTYTANVLLTSVMSSFFLVLGLMVLQGLLTRWLTLGSSRLEYRAALERREADRTARAAAAEGAGADESDFDFEEPKVDYAGLSNDSRMLVRTVILFFALFWLWLIWSPVVPAISVLDEVSLWSRTVVMDGAETQIPVSLMDLLKALVIAAVTVVATKGLPSLVEMVLLHRFPMSASGRYTATTLLRYAIIGVGGLTVIGMLGVSWSKAQWLVAALGVGIGFGLQEIVANFISGLVLLFERPIRIGDVVTVGETSGVVTRIQIRATTIRDWDRRELLVPNKEFITTRLLNWSLSDEVIRLLIPVGVAYGSDMMLAMKLAEEAAREHPDVLDDPAPFVIFEGFGDNALNIGLRAYLPSVENRLGALSDINQTINQKFAEAGIVIAFPQRDVHLDTARPLDVRIHPAGDRG